MATKAKANYQELYESKIVKSLQAEFNYVNPMQVPRLVKICVNMGVRDPDTKGVNAAAEDLKLITGQKPVITKAKKSIAGFKLREGQPVGCSVTLRGRQMFEFLERLVNIAMPRIRDFRGVSPKSFDGRGNFALGLKEQIVFPEIEYDKIDKVRGMDIIVVTSATNDNEARALLKAFNVPFITKEGK